MGFKIIGVRENKEYLEKAIDYFTENWGIDRRIYEDCIRNSITTQNPLPRWFLMLNNDEIIGSYGLITNDFISRQDLYPWVCALYVENDYRGKKLGAKLLEHGRIEAAKLGYKKIYLSTDHNGYYERYGWVNIGNGIHPWGSESKLYEHDTMIYNENLKFLGNPELETNRLILRKLDVEDVLDVYKYAKNPDVAKYVPWEHHKSIEDSYCFINWTIDRVHKDEAGDWGIQLKETNKIIGSIGFAKFDIQNSCGEIGYALSKDYWGKGIMTEALKRVINFAFDKMSLNRLEAAHFVENEASGKVMQKSGMRYEGLLHKKMLAKGVFRDVKQYAIVKNNVIMQ